MENPELSASLLTEQNNVEYYQLALQRTGSRALLENRALEQEFLQEANGRYLRVFREMQKLNVQAPYTSELQMYAYIGEYDLQRLFPEGEVKFYPENSYFKPVEGKIIGVDSANLNTLDYEILSSTSGGPIAAIADNETGKLQPENPLYLVRIAIDQTNVSDLPILIRGRVLLKGERKSFISRFFNSLLGTIIRESGF